LTSDAKKRKRNCEEKENATGNLPDPTPIRHRKKKKGKKIKRKGIFFKKVLLQTYIAARRKIFLLRQPLLLKSGITMTSNRGKRVYTRERRSTRS